MAFDVSLLNDIIIERLDPIIQVIEEDSLLRVLDGSIDSTEAPCPSVYRATYLIPDVPILPCCSGYGEAGSARQKDFEVACYMSALFYCETDLAKLFRGAGNKVKYTAGSEGAGAAGEAICRANQADFIKKFNKLLLLGDKASSDTDLNPIDGWITQAIAGGAVQPTITAGNLWAAFVQILFALPKESAIYGEQLVMFVPNKFRKFYKLFFAYNRLWYGDSNMLDDIYGTDGVRIVYTHALDDTNQILLTPSKNLVAIVSDNGDEYTYEWDYIKNWKDGDRYGWRIKGCIGVGLYDPTMAVVATISDEIAANTTVAIDVNIVNQPVQVEQVTAGAGTQGASAKVSAKTAAAGTSTAKAD